LSVAVRVHVVDPSAFTPPYDHALCTALGDAGAEVELLTSRFAYGSVMPARSYRREEVFYRHAMRIANPAARRIAKVAEHVPDMLRYRRRATQAEIVHFQWLTLQQVDWALLPRGRPLVITAHDVLPREPRPGQRRGQRRLYERFDAIVVHSRHGRDRLTGELGIAPERVHVIPHGVFSHLAEQPAGRAPIDTPLPVVLCFGLMRPYKGIDVLLRAWRGIEGAELWIAGMPRMDIAPLVEAAPPGVRFFPRFIGDAELPAFFRAASLVVLPYREIDQSGVLSTALAFGKPLLLSDVGGFPEIAATGAAQLAPAGDAQALHGALAELLADPVSLRGMAERSQSLSSGEHSWASVAERTLALYRSLL
jgi:glycosyltransferase involved in cell wall biosynthesis